MAAMSKRLEDKGAVRELYNGDRLQRAEFHLAYCQMPEEYRAELIGGMVFEPSPLGYAHGKNHVKLSYLFETYAMSTPGVEVADNASVFLSDEDEVQPDLVLRTIQQCGGRSHLTDDDYIEGAPELVAEVANSSRAIDLHLKKERYAAAGVLEYLVLSLRPKELFWFDLHGQQILKSDADGIIRSVVFPGLWLHREAVIKLDNKLSLEVLNSGLRSPEHKKFVSQLNKEQ